MIENSVVTINGDYKIKAKMKDRLPIKFCK